MGEEKKKKGGALKIIIIVLLVLIVVGGGAFAGYYFLFAKDKEDDSNSNANHNLNNQVVNNQQVANGANPVIEISPYTAEIEEFLVNLADEGGKRYLKAKLSIGYNTKEKKKMDPEFEEKKAVIRDAIISVLRSKKSADFTPKGVEDLKKEIIVKISPIFEYGRPNNIYFQDILVQ